MALNSTPTIDCAYESKKHKHKDKGAILCLSVHIDVIGSTHLTDVRMRMRLGTRRDTRVTQLQHPTSTPNCCLLDGRRDIVRSASKTVHNMQICFAYDNFIINHRIGATGASFNIWNTMD